jgi:CHAT domain-containing protein/tetratricopeptide (TPR) repeat protein
MMKQIVFTICLAFLALPTLWGQDQADGLFDEAMTLAEDGEFKLANNKLREAAELYKKDNNLSMYYQALAEQGRNTLDAGDGKKALEYLESLKEEADQTFKKADIAQSLIHKYIGYVYYYDGDVVAAYQPFQKALEIRTEANPEDPELFRDNYNLGVISRNISRLSESLEYYFTAIELLGDKPDENYLYKMYLQIATVYKIQENYGAAEDYISRAISIVSKIHGENSIELAKVLMEKGNIQAAGSSDVQAREAFKTLKDALEIYENDQTAEEIDIIVCLQALGYAYLSQYDEENEQFLKLAKEYYQRANAITSKNYADSYDHLYTLEGLFSVHAKSGELDLAQKCLDDIKELNEKLEIPLKSAKWANYYLKLGELNELKNASIDEVAAIYNKALESLIEEKAQFDLHKTSIEPYLDLEKLNLASLLTDVLAKKAISYLKYSKGKDVQLLEYGFSHFEEYEKVIDFLRKEYASSGSKLAWSDFVVEDFGTAIDICIALSEAKNDKSYLEKAYYFSEKSKGLLLLESFQSTKANKYAGLPEAVIQEEESLRLAVSDAKQQLFQLKQGGKLGTDAYRAKQTEWLDKKEAYAKFVKRIEKEHPDYYKMKYDINILDVAATQEMLLDDQDLIEYYITTEQMFVFKLGKTSFEVIKLDAPENLLKMVQEFRESVYGYYLNAGERTESGYDKYSKQYAEVGFQMYQTLVEPLGELKKRLIIIPAGALSNMPFEPILTKKPEDPKQYKSHAYFVKDHIIAYNYSATLLSEMRSRQYGNNRETLLAVAPEFGTEAASFVRGKRFALAPLTFNTVEVENVKKMLGRGTLLMGQDALEPKFKEMGGDYKIIHFATHGMANDRDPDFSLLAFTEIPDSVENEFLYVSDLYNMELKTDLIVLSACETGLGELRRGEGVISLARGFAYAGTKSIFTTLWSVNDQATANIIEGFYSHLKAGKPKDEALHLAKLDFLEGGNNMTSHPFLWAPYIFIGDSEPLELGGGIPWLYIGIGAAALLLLIGGFMMMKKGKREEA